MKTKILFLLIGLLSALSVSAQEQQVEMADTLRSEGKIYVVVTCIALVFAGLLVFLIILDRKVNRLEKMVKNK